jgi:(1->4)-alpha-D-glucan 1-alpha-D-glucosylmutase
MIAPRWFMKLNADWGDPMLDVPLVRWQNVFDGRLLKGGACRLQDMLHQFPVALLCRESS